MLNSKKTESFQDEHLSNTRISANRALKVVVAFSIPSPLNTLKLTLILLSIVSVIFFVLPSFTSKNAEARCPNGTHKSPSGDCEKVKPHEGKHRCPNGSHRSPGGDCEKVGAVGDSSSNNEDNDNVKDDDNSIPSTSSSFSSDNEQPPSQTTSGASNTLQIPKSPSSSTIPAQNTVTPSPPQQQGSYLSYENPAYGFTIQYPSNWSKTEQPEAGRVVSFDDTNKGVQVYVKHDKFPAQYSTLTEYVNATANQIGMDRRDFGLMEYYPNLTIHNNPASKFVYLSTKKVGVNIGTQYETMRLWMMKGDDVYTLVYVTQPNLFPQYLPIANNMLKSFKITR